MLVGCWASCANVGDIIGTDIYTSIYSATDNWGLPFIVCGSLVLSFGILSMLLLIEYPIEKGIVILEKGTFLSASKVPEQ